MTGWPGHWREVAPLVDQLAANAWPAGRTQVVDGWLLRVTPGVERRRSNSALPLLVAPAPAAAHRRQVDLAEAFYRHQGQVCWVQVSPAELHDGLDTELRRRGYDRAAPIDIHLAAVERVLDATAGAPDLEVRGDARVTVAWLRAQMRVEPRPVAAQAAEAGWILGRICPPVRFLAAVADGEAVGVCLVVAERGWAGVFSMATHPAARRRGVGTALLRAGAEWAAAHGARGLYLLVEPDNEPALGLYARVGFERAYGYHYRAAPPDTGGARPLRDFRR